MSKKYLNIKIPITENPDGHTYSYNENVSWLTESMTFKELIEKCIENEMIFISEEKQNTYNNQGRTIH